MDPSPDRRLTAAWIVVVVVTLTYSVIDRSVDDNGVMGASTVVSVAAIALSLAKLRIILREFMDVRHAPRVLRTMTDALVVIMGTCLLGTYLVGRSIA